MLTQRSRYALRALMVMAKAGDSAPVSMNFIAAEANVPRKFLELILTDLRQAGLVVSFRGKIGGFRLARPPHLTSFGDIIRTIDWPMALLPSVSRTAQRPCNHCSAEASSALRRAMTLTREDTTNTHH